MMTAFEWLDAISTDLLMGLISSFAAGVFIALICWGITRCINAWRPINASTRYALWVSVLLLCVGMMLWQVSHNSMLLLKENTSLSVEEKKYNALSDLAGEPVEDKSERETKAVVTTSNDPESYISAGEVRTEIESDAHKTSGSLIAGIQAKVRHSKVTLGMPPPQLLRMLFISWLCIAGILIIRLIASLLLISRIKRNASPARNNLVGSVRQSEQRVLQRRTVNVGVSREIPSAVAAGYFYPMILLPEGMLNELNDEEIEQIILHELAHIRRYDDWTILLQQIVSAIFFFHPAVWALGHLMNRDREIACDDWVISLARTPKSYATCLAKVASMKFRTPRVLFAAQATSGKHQLFTRVKRILDRNRTISVRISRLLYICIVAFTLVIIQMLQYLSPEVAFSQPVSQYSVEQSARPEISVYNELEKESEKDEQKERNLKSGEQIPSEPSQIEENGFSRVTPNLETIAPAKLQVSTVGSTLLKDSLGVVEKIGDDKSTHNTSLENVLPSAKNQQDEPLSKKSMMRWLEAVRSISSPSEKSQLLVKVVPVLHQDVEVQNLFLKVAFSLSSDMEKTRALSALLEANVLRKEALISALNGITQIGSEANRARILMLVLEYNLSSHWDDGELRESFDMAMNSLASSREYERVAKALIKAKPDNR